MFDPCYEHCYLRWRKEYTKECDNTCNYARLYLENKKLKEIFDELGISLTDENDNFRSTQDILKEITDKWNTFKS